MFVQWATRQKNARPGCGEDRVEAIPLKSSTVFVVADGAGGVAGGAAAAEAICGAVVEQCRRGLPNDWSRCLASVDRRMSGSSGLAAAVVVEVRDDGSIVGASVGDCEAWTFVDDAAINLTVEQVRKPLLGEGKARPVGFERICDPTQVEEYSLVVATDGLWKYLDRDRIVTASALRPLDMAVEALVEGVRMWSGFLQDDVAIALIESKQEQLAVI